MTDTSRSLQRRRLARTLRRWRTKAGLSIERAATELLCGVGTIHRMETGESAEPLRVKAALELYGAPPEVVADMVQAAKQGRRRGVTRRPYHEFVPEVLAEYFDLENEASTLHVVEGDLVHGLLQTEAYARAVISGGDPYIAPTEVERHLAVRMERQRRLTDDNPIHLEVLLGEGALHCRIGGPQVLRDQLRHLAEVNTDLPNVTVRVLPWSAGMHPALGRNFTMLTFPGAEEPEMVFAENISFFVLQDDEQEIAKFRVAYDRAKALALSPADSTRLITRVAEGIDA